MTNIMYGMVILKKVTNAFGAVHLLPLRRALQEYSSKYRLLQAAYMNADPEVDDNNCHSRPGHIGQERQRSYTLNSSFNSGLITPCPWIMVLTTSRDYNLRYSDGQYEDKTPEGFELRPIPVDDDRRG